MFGAKPVFRNWLAQPIPAASGGLAATNASLPIVVVGAGPGGLSAMAALEQAGIPYIGVESHQGVGGIWDQSNPVSTVYDLMNTNTSRDTTHVGPPMPAEWPLYPHHTQAKQYLERFAEQRNLLSRIRFGTRFVDAQKQNDGSWKVVLQPVGGNDAETIDARAVVIATGVHNQHRRSVPQPLWDEAAASGAEVIHSGEYRRSSDYAGKQVLVVGLGQSGTDIAQEISRDAARVVLASRSTPWIFPSVVLGKPADQLTDERTLWVPDWIQAASGILMQRAYVGHPRRLGIPSPDHRLLEKFAVTDRGFVRAARRGQVGVCADLIGFAPGGTARFGSPPREQAFDTIVFATGYRRSYPLLDAPDQADGELADRLRFLVFHPTEPGLTYMAETIATRSCWPVFAAQGRALAAYFAAEQRAAKNVDEFNRRRSNLSPDFKGNVFRKADKFHVEYFRYTRAMHDLADWLEA